MTLVIEGLSKRLGGFQLQDLQLTVHHGEYFVLLGPSGVGKTVLLELIAGVRQADHGRIAWDGREVTHLPPENRNIALVYQDYALFPHMSVEANLGYGLRARGFSNRDLRRRVRQAAEQFRITEFLSRKPAALSGGEQQRVALTRALVLEPELLLLDEPLSAIDLKLRRCLRAELKQLHEISGATLLHVTHDLEEALVLGQRIGVMLDGEVRQTGTPEQVFHRPSDPAVAEFLGLRNVFAAQPIGDGTCSVNGIEVHTGVRAQPFRHIWIRPEEILLSRASFTSSARNQLACRVQSLEPHDVLICVQLTCGDLHLIAMITYASYSELQLAPGAEVYATFKSSAIQTF